MGQTELDKILENHRLYLSSQGREGTLANIHPSEYNIFIMEDSGQGYEQSLNWEDLRKAGILPDRIKEKSNIQPSIGFGYTDDKGKERPLEDLLNSL